MFWCSGSGLTFDYPRKIIPWYERPRGGASEWMIDSGVKSEPPTVTQLVEAQARYADVAVCPDILGDYQATLARTSAWFPMIRMRAPHVTTVLCTHGTIPERLKLMDAFPEVDWIGFGVGFSAPGIRFDPAARERVLRTLVPEVHSRGKRAHVFGWGCTGPAINLLRELRVNSFDSSAPTYIASHGKVFDTALRQVHIGGPDDADAKRLRVYLNLRQLALAIERGPTEQAERLDSHAEALEIPGQGKLFGGES